MPTLADLQNQRQNFFKQKRDEVVGQQNANLQQNTDALQRRFTAMGAANTGAAIQAQQNAMNQNDIAKRNALNDVNAQEMQAGEGDLARQFQSQEAQLGRDFQGGLAGQDLAFKQKLADTEQGNKLAQLDMARQQFELDKDTAAFNKRMAEIAAAGAGQNPGPLAGLGINGTPSEIYQDYLKKALLGPLSSVGRSDRGGLGVQVGGISF